MSEQNNFKGGGLLYPEDKNYSIKREWHIFYLRPRTEKIVCRMLTNLGYEVFYPVIHRIKIWKNRQKKKIRLPLFPNYMFVYTYPHELYAIRCFPQVVSYVSCAGKPSTISEREVEGIRRMLGLGSVISVETRFSKGEQVRIISGPLKGHEGILVKRRSKSRFGIRLKAIDHAVFIDICQSDLEKL
ncbi:MAG: UpxY family transcription antiterminator [Spirochaetes bacterium]|nr:UpxY family transcription antiterminator [Spirochaetota bacterium]